MGGGKKALAASLVIRYYILNRTGKSCHPGHES